MSRPHYLQFARALALVGGLASCASSAPAEEAEQGSDDDSAGSEAPGGSGEATAGSELNGCTCDGTPMGPTECRGLSSCEECCMRGAIMVGPLAPPDLPA